MTDTPRTAAATLLALCTGACTVASLGACTTQMAYNTGQEWQKEQCRKLPDLAERQRCEKSNAMTYDKYKAEAEAASSGRGKPSP
jgi:hypothetical protein